MKFETLEHWEEAPVVRTSRTRLYNLEPLGLGTSMVECLSSYIHRIAAAHGLPTWLLVCREIAPRCSRKSMLSPNGHCDLFGKVGMTINGANKTALEMASILELLTGRKGLRSLTFFTLEGMVAEQRILRTTQAWCPKCLEDWRRGSRPIYQPLAWTLSSLRRCCVHGCFLEDCCPTCGKRHLPLGRYNWNGICPKCLSWLGRRLSTGPIYRNGRQPEWDVFAAHAVARFVSAIQSLGKNTQQRFFPMNFGNLIQDEFDGNFSAVAKVLRVHRSTVCNWARGRQRPSLLSLIALAYCCGGEPLDWLTTRITVADLRLRSPAWRNLPHSLRAPLRRHRPEVMQVRLNSAIGNGRFPPPSFSAFCRQFDVNPAAARRRFSTLAAEVISKHRQFQAASKSAREKFRKSAVQSAVSQLIAEGRLVSYNQISKILPRGVSLRNKSVRLEFRKLRSNWNKE